MYTFTVEGSDVTAAWIKACQALDTKANEARSAFHTIVRITDPIQDDPDLHRHLDRVRAGTLGKDYEPIDTVASTIFPAGLAASSGDHERLVARYREMYGRLRRFSGNHHGTYFGRLIAYPGPKGGPPVDQIGWVINRLGKQAASRGPMTAAYEVDVAHPETDEEPVLSDDTHIHIGGQDNLIRGFPCLSHCSFQLESHQIVHATAYYRYHTMLDRAYGNYLGLGRLLDYVAAQAGLTRGCLTVMAGYALIEKGISQLRPLLSGTPLVSAD